mgnify:CR=1 FL=1
MRSAVLSGICNSTFDPLVLLYCGRKISPLANQSLLFCSVGSSGLRVDKNGLGFFVSSFGYRKTCIMRPRPQARNERVSDWFGKLAWPTKSILCRPPLLHWVKGDR